MASTILSKTNIPRYFFIFLAAGLVSAFSYFRVFELYELQTYDWRCQLRGPRPVSEDIVLIDIWDDTLKELGAWPFDREYHKELINILSASGMKALAMDILFVEPREGDEAVARAAQNAGNVYFVYAFPEPQRDKKGVFRSEKMLAPLIPEYEKAARGTGHVNAKADLDGKRRKVHPVIYYQDKPCYQLSFQIAADVLGINAEDLKVPLDDEGYFPVNFAGRWEKTFPHYSYFDILAAYLETASGVQPRLDLEKLRGKIGFVGLTSLGSHDTSPVPIQSVYPMVGLHANVLNSILKNDFIRRLGRVWNLTILWAMILWILFIVASLRPVKALLTAMAALFVFAVAVIVCFIQWALWVDLFYPFVLFIVAYAAATLARTMREVRKRELIENELKIASQIQQSFLPVSVPEQQGLELAVFMRPAKAVGGDLYTFVALNGGKMGVMVGDVSGKGTPAALFMAKAVSEFKLFSREKIDPAQVLTDLNHSLASESTGGLFVTLAYAIFDTKGHKVRFSNGGHLPMILVREKEEAQFLSGGEGMPIGVVDDAPFSDAEVEMKAGDCLAFYSDGVSEARNRKKEEFGAETLQKYMAENKHQSAQVILDNIVGHLTRFVGRAEQHDDITLIIAKIGPGNGK